MQEKVLKETGPEEIWRSIDASLLEREAPINFGIQQRVKMRMCTNYKRINNTKSESVKVRLLGARAGVEIWPARPSSWTLDLEAKRT